MTADLLVALAWAVLELVRLRALQALDAEPVPAPDASPVLAEPILAPDRAEREDPE